MKLIIIYMMILTHQQWKFYSRIAQRDAGCLDASSSLTKAKTVCNCLATLQFLSVRAVLIEGGSRTTHYFVSVVTSRREIARS
jgi:hypothetical protein